MPKHVNNHSHNDSSHTELLTLELNSYVSAPCFPVAADKCSSYRFTSREIIIHFNVMNMLFRLSFFNLFVFF